MVVATMQLRQKTEHRAECVAAVRGEPCVGRMDASGEAVSRSRWIVRG